MQAFLLQITIIFISSIVFANTESCYLRLNEGQNYPITDYKNQVKSCRISSDQRTVEQLRVFRSQGSEYAWVVDKFSLISYVVPTSCVVSCGDAKSDLRYDSLLKDSTDLPFKLENDGLTKDLKTNNNYMTIDLCPSSKPFEQDFFQYLGNYTDVKKEIFPVAIAISGGWMLKHKDEFQQILNLQKTKKIQITWVNHTRNHPYTVGIESEHNFLLRQGVDPLSEIIEQEKLMLSHGLIPSIFLRYPGLVSDQNLVELTKSLGLIPLGSQSWVGKTKSFSPGDILLLHGNGNERKGIEIFFSLVRDSKIFNFTWRALTQWGQ